jgi:cellulose biosynthesis protein BcsQ
MQGKGGAGKSLTSSMLVQYLRYTDHRVQAIDLDPTRKRIPGSNRFPDT